MGLKPGMKVILKIPKAPIFGLMGDVYTNDKMVKVGDFIYRENTISKIEKITLPIECFIEVQELLNGNFKPVPKPELGTNKIKIEPNNSPIPC